MKNSLNSHLTMLSDQNPNNKISNNWWLGGQCNRTSKLETSGNSNPQPPWARGSGSNRGAPLMFYLILVFKIISWTLDFFAGLSFLKYGGISKSWKPFEKQLAGTQRSGWWAGEMEARIWGIWWNPVISFDLHNYTVLRVSAMLLINQLPFIVFWNFPWVSQLPVHRATTQPNTVGHQSQLSFRKSRKKRNNSGLRTRSSGKDVCCVSLATWVPSLGPRKDRRRELQSCTLMLALRACANTHTAVNIHDGVKNEQFKSKQR